MKKTIDQKRSVKFNPTAEKNPPLQTGVVAQKFAAIEIEKSIINVGDASLR